MQVFVAGATGTIGASLIKQLLTSGQAAQDIRAVRVRRTAWWGLPRQRQSQARTALASGDTELSARPRSTRPRRNPGRRFSEAA
jgi:nucleoside-diphosphate-sugar epimerase